MLSSRFGGTASSSSFSALNANLNYLQHWRAALAKVRDGAADAKLLFVGDSTTAGAGGSLNPGVNNSAGQRLVTLFNNCGIPSAQGLGLPPSPLSGGTDIRWTTTGTWVQTGNYGFCKTSYGSSTNGSVLTYTPSGGASYDTFDVYYATALGAGFGTFDVQATGGTVSHMNGNQSAAIRKVTVTAASAGTSNSVSITVTGTAAVVYILGVEPYHSTTRRIRSGVAGVGSSTSSNWTENPSGLGSVPSIQTMAPDLTVIDLGINDASGSVSVSTFLANITSLVTAARVSGDVILKTMMPSTDTSRRSYESLYASALQSYAQSNNIPLYDYWGSVGGLSPTLLQYTDGVHPNNYGYWDMAQQMFNILTYLPQ